MTRISARNGVGGDECRGDLLARERRGALSHAEGLALQAHLADCGSCRLARQVFADLEAVSGVDLRDGARIERMTMTARRFVHQGTRPAPRARKRRRRLGTLGIGALVVLLGGTASATVWLWRHPQVVQVLSFALDGKAPGAVASAPRRRGGTTIPASASAPPADLTGDAVEEAPPPDAPPVSAVSPSPPRRQAIRGARIPSAPARLLRQASDLRRGGDLDDAAALYKKLQQDFPRSPEAVLSSLALGGLLLERSLPRAALAQFDAYLRSSRGGGLIPEALYGRGRALAALGDREEERRTWDRLLADFPDSAYGPLARRRLADLK